MDHLQPAETLEQPSLLGLPLNLALGLHAPAEQRTGAIEQLALLPAHRDRLAAEGASGRNPNSEIGSDLLDRFAAADRLQGNPDLQPGSMGAVFAQLLR